MFDFFKKKNENLPENSKLSQDQSQEKKNFFSLTFDSLKKTIEKTGESLVGKNPFAVILADDLCFNNDEGVLTQMMRVYEKYRCSIVAIEEVDTNEVHKYGIIEADELENGVYKVKSMIEKPDKDNAPSNLAIIGRYILTPDIFNILRMTKPGINGELQITDALLEQAKLGRVIGYRFKGTRYDCGSLDGFVRATNDFYQRMKK